MLQLILDFLAKALTTKDLSYLTLFDGDSSNYLMVEGKSIADSAGVYVSTNASLNCKAANFPTVYSYCWSLSVSQKNLFQLNAISKKTLIVFGILIVSVNQGFTVKVQNIPVMDLTN